MGSHKKAALEVSGNKRTNQTRANNNTPATLSNALAVIPDALATTQKRKPSVTHRERAKRRDIKNGKARPGATLNREHFATSRMMEFFAEKELVAQTGHSKDQWPAVVLKEGIDNALDGCEDTGAAPVIKVTATPDRITIADNGPGIPADVLERILNYSVRISSREA